MPPSIHYRFHGLVSTGGTFPLAAFALTGGFQDESSAAPVITDLRDLPEASRTAIHRPAIANDPGVPRGTVIYLNIDAPTRDTVITSYALPNTNPAGPPAGSDLSLSVSTSYSNAGMPTQKGAGLGNVGTSGAAYIHVIQSLSKNYGGTTYTRDAFLASDLNAGATVGTTGNYNGGVELYTALDAYGYPPRGQFLSSGSSGYVGFRFSRSGQTHYGFVFIRIGSSLEVIVDYVGWESTPGVAITTQAPAPSVPLPKVDVEVNRTTQRIIVSWNEEPGKTYNLQQSDNLVTWGPASGSYSLTGNRRQFSSPLNLSPRRFYRVSVQ